MNDRLEVASQMSESMSYQGDPEQHEMGERLGVASQMSESMSHQGNQEQHEMENVKRKGTIYVKKNVYIKSNLLF
jgi:hypothetical protein